MAADVSIAIIAAGHHRRIENPGYVQRSDRASPLLKLTLVSPPSRSLLRYPHLVFSAIWRILYAKWRSVQMATKTEQNLPVSDVAYLLGGSSVLRYAPKTRLEAHELLLKGLPGKALVHLVDNLVVLSADNTLSYVIGVSPRTFQRTKTNPKRPLTKEQSGRTWKFAEILAKATAVFGTQKEAEHWLEQPATGLDQRKPIDLIATPAGAELVERFLNRLDYGVYM